MKYREHGTFSFAIFHSQFSILLTPFNAPNPAHRGVFFIFGGPSVKNRP
jgi:hypothetical protein